MDWPEQSVVLGAYDISDQVGRTELVDLESAKMVRAYIARLAPGETARIAVPAKIVKRPQIAPEDSSAFTFDSRPDRGLQRYLRASPQIESSHRKIKQLAHATIEIDESATAWQQVATICDWVRENIEYRFEETNRSCLEALANKQGDCGEMTGLFVAICRARGIPARAVWIPEHSYGEFYLVDSAGAGHWFPCQVAGDEQFGAMIEARPILQKGDSFKVPGQSRATRYAQPTLAAKEASGPLDVRWIMRRVDDPESRPSNR
jgi:hypothetical protein